MPGSPFKKPARPKASASVKQPHSPNAARSGQSRVQMPGVASGKGMGMKSVPLKSATVVGKPKAGPVRSIPKPRTGAPLFKAGRHA